MLILGRWVFTEPLSSLLWGSGTCDTWWKKKQSLSLLIRAVIFHRFNQVESWNNNLIDFISILIQVIFIISFYYLFLEKAMAPHSSTLAWKIPWMAEPGRLQSMGSLRVGHDWVTSLSLFPFTHWRRKWRPTPVFLPGEPQGPGSLVGFRLWGHTESDTTEAT